MKIIKEFCKVVKWKGLLFVDIIICSLLLVSCLILSNSMQPHRQQNARLPCPSPSPEFTQIHVNWVNDAIHTSHPLLSPSPLALSLSQHKSLSQWISSSHWMAKVLEFQLQHQSFNEYSGLISFRIDWFDLLASKGLSRVFSSTKVWDIISSMLSIPYGPILISIHDYWKKI